MNYARTVTKRISALGLQHSLLSPFSIISNARVFGTLPTRIFTGGVSTFDAARGVSSISYEFARKGNWDLRRGQNSNPTLQKPGYGLHRGRLEQGNRMDIVHATRSREYASGTPKFGNLTEKEYQKYPDRPKRLSASELQAIFGDGAHLGNGNKFLQILQKHRITGTLDQEIALPGYTDVHLARGLLWLRAKYPVDEDAAITRRIELEEAELEEKYIAEIGRLNTYRPQESAKEHGVYGKSELDDLRAYNREKNKREEEAAVELRRKQADDIRSAAPDSALIQHPSGRAILARRSEEPEWIKKYKERAKLSEGLEAPEMSKTERLLPSAIFAVLTIGACIIFSQNYKPPPVQARMFTDLPPAAATIAGIICLNLTAFLMWRTPPLWRFMNKYFLVIAATPKAPSLLGNIFSHQSFTHLATNMVVLWFVGPKLHDQIGRGNFIALYVSCGVFASFISLTRFVLMKQLIQSSLGASGAILGIVSCYLALNSGNKFSFAWWPFGRSPEFSPTALLLCFAAIEFVGIYRSANRFDHFAHLAGMFSGVVSAETLKYRARLKRVRTGLI